MEERRKDHWQMLTLHLVTITLLAYCYAYHQTRVGSVILVLLDVIDLFLPLAKCLKYLGFGVICDVIFGGFIVSWVIARHGLYNFTCWRIYVRLTSYSESSMLLRFGRQPSRTIYRAHEWLVASPRAVP
ncbi:sphingosine N-acyltransferase lag1 [Beauveria bassiana ARSEF 2860]|uniref:Sphingosine N-acyltransferase lag1 n=1 Tax=Beauveria bassiana (strain ARSEF 2860) TaxID=655819 RepID=J5J501_BEAB2|nr:sphingosine N-acyltransferase lag1 [Beauveria bassiana ARSEF 2860]EJP61708.1 sphingosine N-acyltransferase lag1 [Beauveria bassiana ARSEF 2860]